MGIGDRVSKAKLTGVFAGVWSLRGVQIQERHQGGQRYRVAFVHYSSDEEAWVAIRRLNGLRLEGRYLQVKKALC